MSIRVVYLRLSKNFINNEVVGSVYAILTNVINDISFGSPLIEYNSTGAETFMPYSFEYQPDIGYSLPFIKSNLSPVNRFNIYIFCVVNNILFHPKRAASIFMSSRA